jgi:F-type H+-transporting ATPase subunit delta
LSGSYRIAIPEAAQRYGAALFELATEAKKVAGVEKDAKALLAAWQTSSDLRSAMTSPLFGVEQKAAALDAIAVKLKAQKLTHNFLGLAAQNRRCGDLGGMLAAFLGLAAKARGAVLAEVSTAEPLSDEQLKDLTEALGRAFKGPVDVETTLKPELLGGLVVKIGSRLFDDSVKSKLDALKIAMKGA